MEGCDYTLSIQELHPLTSNVDLFPNIFEKRNKKFGIRFKLYNGFQL